MMSCEELKAEYERFQVAAGGYRRVPRALFAVWGGEAVQFLNGLVTGDVSKIEDGKSIPVAFPTAQGRIFALARVLKDGDRFLIDADSSVHDKLFRNLQRFTFAGDFHLEDLTTSMTHVEIFPNADIRFEADAICFDTSLGVGIFIPDTSTENLVRLGLIAVSDELAECLRIERGIPVFGFDADENTVVSELGIADLISYNKGCYIGQEIIARIHFRGHVAKIMRGLVFDEDGIDPALLSDDLAIQSLEGKPAGTLTSVARSPHLGKVVGLGMVRYEFRDAGTRLLTSKGRSCVVSDFPIVVNS